MLIFKLPDRWFSIWFSWSKHCLHWYEFHSKDYRFTAQGNFLSRQSIRYQNVFNPYSQKFQKLKRVCCRTSGTGVAYCVWRNKTFVDTALVALIVSHHPVKFVSVVNEEESFKALKRLEVFPERDRKTEISQIDINKSIPDRVMSPYQLRSIIFNVVFTFLSSSEV